MTSSVQAMRVRLIQAWESIPDNPPPDQVDALCARAWGLVRLIGWIDTHETASMPEYRAEVARLKEEDAR